MRNRNENEFFNSDYGRFNNGSSNFNHQGHSQDRGWANRAGDEVQSWFGNDEAERRRRMDERRDYGSDNGNRYDNSGYDRGGNYGANAYGNYGSAYNRNYGTNQSNFGRGNQGTAYLDTDSSRYSHNDYDPLRNVYGGPGNTDRGYGHASHRDFDMGDNSRGMGNNYRSDNRDWTERTGDEVRSWFGNDEAERRRRMDEMRDNHEERSRDRDWNDRDRGFSRW